MDFPSPKWSFLRAPATSNGVSRALRGQSRASEEGELEPARAFAPIQLPRQKIIGNYEAGLGSFVRLKQHPLSVVMTEQFWLSSSMSYVMVDVESDGPIPGDYSLVCFGAIVVEPGLQRTFYGRLRPISEKWLPDALKVSGFSREETLAFDEPKDVMAKFDAWLKTVGQRIFFISDNNGFDWQFINWYFHHFLGRNPFGHSSSNLGSLYKGLVKDMFQTFKHLRSTAHTHDPVDDARGNAEALLRMKEELGLKISWD